MHAATRAQQLAMNSSTHSGASLNVVHYIHTIELGIYTVSALNWTGLATGTGCQAVPGILLQQTGTCLKHCLIPQAAPALV
jgi:hypothetical protein